MAVRGSQNKETTTGKYEEVHFFKTLGKLHLLMNVMWLDQKLEEDFLDSCVSFATDVSAATHVNQDLAAEVIHQLKSVKVKPGAAGWT